MNQTNIHGILNINKPYGVTSMDMVRRVKRASRQKRVGHGGTLDPIATGVIPICIGQATRIMDDLVRGTKIYRSVIELGAATDTYDALGTVTSTAELVEVTREQIEAVLQTFKGEIQQIPPMYSALKKDGKRLYDLARAGVEVEREPRQVTVQDITLTEWDSPNLTVEVTCGKGFYMRSLAHDIGQALGCGGHMKSLVRLKVGAFLLSEALTIEEAEDRFADGSWGEVLHPIDAVLTDLRAIVVGKRLEDMVKNGRSLAAGHHIPSSRNNERCRVYTVDGRFIAIIKFQASDRCWRPDKVFPLAYPEPVGVA